MRALRAGPSMEYMAHCPWRLDICPVMRWLNLNWPVKRRGHVRVVLLLLLLSLFCLFAQCPCTSTEF